jgi:hypothetical protein
MAFRKPWRALLTSTTLTLASAAIASGSSAVLAQSKEIKVTDSMPKAMEVGKAFVKQKFPDFSVERKKPVIQDKGENWEFTYELPADMLGGSPVVIIRKSDLSVKEYFRYQ